MDAPIKVSHFCYYGPFDKVGGNLMARCALPFSCGTGSAGFPSMVRQQQLHFVNFGRLPIADHLTLPAER